MISEIRNVYIRRAAIVAYFPLYVALLVCMLILVVTWKLLRASAVVFREIYGDIRYAVLFDLFPEARSCWHVVRNAWRGPAS